MNLQFKINLVGKKTKLIIGRETNRLREWGLWVARKFQGSGEIDAMEGIALAIRKVEGVRAAS